MEWNVPPGLGFYVSQEIDPGNKDGKDGKDHEDRKRPINTMRIMSDEDDKETNDDENLRMKRTVCMMPGIAV